MPMIASSSELTIVSTPASRISGPVAPKKSKSRAFAKCLNERCSVSIA